jgi:hypothetical protein
MQLSGVPEESDKRTVKPSLKLRPPGTRTRDTGRAVPRRPSVRLSAWLPADPSRAPWRSGGWSTGLCPPDPTIALCNHHSLRPCQRTSSLIKPCQPVADSLAVQVGDARARRAVLQVRAGLRPQGHQPLPDAMGHTEVQTVASPSTPGLGTAGRGRPPVPTPVRPLAVRRAAIRPGDGSRVNREVHARCAP